jgi:HTH-type transcriptional regulator / antitoxin HigA
MAKKMIRPIRTETEYEEALEQIERYFESEPKPATSEADRFDLLALTIEDYERKRWPIDPPATIDAIRYRMETDGYTQADLGRLLGSRQRASDILTKKRPLTMNRSTPRLRCRTTCSANWFGCEARATASGWLPKARPSAGPWPAGSSETARFHAGWWSRREA